MPYITEKPSRFGGKMEKVMDLHRFTADLAREMGGRFIKTEDSDRLDTFSTFVLGNEEITIYVDWKKKVTISIRALDVKPDDINRYDRSHDTASASVNPDGRTIKAIAADIRKRVIDASQDALRLQRERVAQRTDARAQIASAADQLKALDIDVRVGNDGLSGSISNKYGKPYFSGSFHTNTVSIERLQSMSVEKFARILAIINE